MTAPYYRDFMENGRSLYSEDASPAIRGRQCLQLGGAPHVGRWVMDFLNGHFERRWIGNKWTVASPTRSPASNPLDFFLWG
jgi:hypothetical protein